MMWSPLIESQGPSLRCLALRDRERRRRHRERASGRSAAEDLGGGRIWSEASARRPACRPGKFFRRTGWRGRLRDLALRETCRNGLAEHRRRRPLSASARARHPARCAAGRFIPHRASRSPPRLDRRQRPDTVKQTRSAGSVAAGWLSRGGVTRHLLSERCAGPILGYTLVCSARDEAVPASSSVAREPTTATPRRGSAAGGFEDALRRTTAIAA